MLPPAAERRAALEARVGVWRPLTISQALDSAVVAHPDRPFVITDERAYSYLDIQAWAERLGRGLVASGVRPGEHVALIMANYPEFVAVKFAISRIGAVAVPVNFLFRGAELRYVLAQSDAVLLITMDRFRDLDYLKTLDEIAPGWPRGGGGSAAPGLREILVFSPEGRLPGGLTSLADLEARAGEEPIPRSEIAPGGLSDILYTSGTTGSPKGVMITHDMVLRTAYGAAYQRALRDGHRVGFALPMYHVFGYVECLLAAMLVGGAVVPHAVFDAGRALAAVARHRVNEVVCVPMMTMALLAEARRHDYDLSSLTTVFSSGGAAPATIWGEIRELLGPEEITTGYGMTETTAATACTMPEGDDLFLATTNGRMREAGIAGSPQLGGHLALYRSVDVDTGLPLPAGSVGELIVQGPIVTPGYYNKPEETAAAFDAEGWLHTGDLGTVDADGYVKLTGRTKESYRCGGEIVVPLEVEALLLTHPGVEAAHVVGVPDDRMGEIGCAWIVPAPGPLPDPDELVAYCAERLARYKVPRLVMWTTAAEVPLTATGRVQKFVLADRARTRLAAGAGGVKV